MSIATLQDEVPQQLRFAEQRRLLSRVAMSISLILTLYLCIVSIVMPLITVGKVIAALAAISIGSLSWLCRYEKLYTMSAAYIVAMTIIGGFVASLSNGGAGGFVAPIMITAPVVAAVFIGARATVFTAIIVVFAIISLWFLNSSGFVSPAPYSAASLEIAAIVMLSASTAICAAGVGYFAHAMQSQIRALRQFQNRLMQVSGQLDHSAHHDSLTGVANRQGMQRHLEQMMAGSLSADELICLIHVDLDEFKSINDTYGHPVGDEVLKQAAQIMTNTFDEDALVARVGGDEFVIVTREHKDTRCEQIEEKCAHLISLIKAPMIANGVECQIGASIGFATSTSDEYAIDSLMTDADLALYEVKRDGRGQARGFTSSMRAKLERDVIFKEKMKAWLTDDSVCCVIQPQVELATGKVMGVEGLGRIQTGSGKLLIPAQVLPVIKEMGRLAEFDFKVMQKSFDALVSLRAAGADIPYVSINASSHSLRSADYVLRVREELRNRGLSTDDVIVEVLESTLIESQNDAAVTSINRLRKAGIKTIMDDFGSGHATISNLMKLELDGLKIDRSLIRDIESFKTQQVVKAVHGLATSLNLTVIVEGVETPQQFAILRSIGCETIQGFGVCKPLELADFADWIKSYGASNVSRLQHKLFQAAGFTRP